MIRNWVVMAVVLGATIFATAADASSVRYHASGVGRSGQGYHPGYYIGYWAGSGHWANSQRLYRPGPRYGYKFGWATYRGDPFAGQDYFDGRNCYYTYKHDYCLGPRWRGGFRGSPIPSRFDFGF
jgi:hypothetical protein